MKVVEGCRIPVKRDLEGQEGWRELLSMNIIICIKGRKGLTAISYTYTCIMTLGNKGNVNHPSAINTHKIA